MKAASLNEIKQELITLPPKKVLELCLKLTKFKKENKELLTYLLFESHDESSYVESIKLEMDEQFAELSISNWFLAKKGLRKILRSISKYSKHVDEKSSEVDMLLHFCKNMQKSGLPILRHKALTTLYEGQVKKLVKLVELVHEDLRFDYEKQIEQLQLEGNGSPIVAKIVTMFKKGYSY